MSKLLHPRELVRAVRQQRQSLALALGLLTLAGVACSSAIETAKPPTQVAPPVSPASTPTPEPAPPTSATTPEATPTIVAQSTPDEPSADSPAPAVGAGEAAASDVPDLNPTGPKNVDPRLFEQLLPRDAIRPIYNPTIVTAKEAQLDSEHLIIGVSISGESRAYPIGPLRFREMVNDELGGTPILVTW